MSKNLHGVEDLLQVVTEGHVLAAAVTVKQAASSCTVALKPGETINALASTISEKFLQPIFFGKDELSIDGVHTYACELLLMGLLCYGFKDAIREGDGPAVMSYWKVLMVIFNLTGHRK